MLARHSSFALACFLGLTAVASGCGDSAEPDLDGDGFPASMDCDDSNAAINADATEVPYDGVDNDCDPSTRDDDVDGDGFPTATDCNDNDATVNPDATEEPYDGVDGDCDPSTLDDDLDEDGFPLAMDCNDRDAAVNPEASEATYDGLDNDCDPSTLDDDLDEDGFPAATDCNDADPAIHPDATDVGWDGADTNCDDRDLGATAANPVRDVRVDAVLDERPVVRLATNGSHALVVGISETGLAVTLSDARDGATLDFSIPTPGDLVPVRVTAFARTAGFGVVYTLPDFGANGWCHVYAHTVTDTGVVGDAVQITAMVPAGASSAAFCDRDPLGVAAESDWVFFMQPQGVTAGNAGVAPQLVRRTLDLDTGSASLSAPVAYGVNQSNRGGQLLDVVYNGEIVALAYTFTSSLATKLTLWNEAGMLNNGSNAQVYGGEGIVFPEPANGMPPVGVRLVGTAFEDEGNTSTFFVTRLEGAAGDRRLERTEVMVTGTGRGTAGATYSAALGAPLTVVDMLDARGNAGAIGFDETRYTWCADDTLVGAIYEVSEAGRPIDASFRASTPVALVDSRQTDTRFVHLLSAGGAYHLVTEEP